MREKEARHMTQQRRTVATEPSHTSAEAAGAGFGAGNASRAFSA